MENVNLNEIVKEETKDLKSLVEFLDGTYEVNSISLDKCKDADLYDFFTEVNDGISNGRYSREDVNKILRDFFDGSFEDVNVIEVGDSKSLVIKGDEYRLL